MREKKHLVVYESQTVLGQLFREIKEIIKGEKGENGLEKENSKNWELDEDLIIEGWQKYRKEAAQIVRDFHSEMDGLLNQFGIRNEFEVYSGNFSKLSKVKLIPIFFFSFLQFLKNNNNGVNFLGCFFS